MGGIVPQFRLEMKTASTFRQSHRYYFGFLVYPATAPASTPTIAAATLNWGGTRSMASEPIPAPTIALRFIF
jgi:hypothetical protein